LKLRVGLDGHAWTAQASQFLYRDGPTWLD